MPSSEYEQVQTLTLRNKRKILLLYMGSLIAASLVVAILPVWKLLVFAYGTGEQSYILLVPVVSFVLIYRKRDSVLQDVTPDFSISGFLLLLPGLLLLIDSYLLASSLELQLVTVSFALVLFWVAAFRICFGKRALRASAFEFAMLLWMIPIPQPIIDWMTYTLQQGSAEVVDWLFTLCRVPVLRSGFIFNLPGQSIEVAKQCSGIRSTLSLLFLSLILAHESLQSNWRRVVVVLCTLPIVVLKNGVRIVTLTLLAIYVDPSFLTGSLHHDGGIVFFLLGLVILMPIIGLLRRRESNRQPKTPLAAGAVAND